MVGCYTCSLAGPAPATSSQQRAQTGHVVAAAQAAPEYLAKGGVKYFRGNNRKYSAHLHELPLVHVVEQTLQLVVPEVVEVEVAGEAAHHAAAAARRAAPGPRAARRRRVVQEVVHLLAVVLVLVALGLLRKSEN